MDRLRSMITANAKVSEDEIRQWYNWENTSVDISYAVFKPNTFKDVEITDQIIEDYYNAHKEEYKTQPQIQARYVKFDPESYKADIVIPPEEIKQYYDGALEEFKTPETVSARHILFKVAKNADEKAVEKARLKAVDVMEKAKSGEDFAELAKTYSEGPSAKDGGQLGAFKREAMVKPFSDAAFSMNVGDISEPVRTQFGWHIIKVEAHNPASTMSLEEATPQITEKLTERKAKNMAYDAALALYDTTFDSEDLEKNTKDSGLKLVTTDFFTRQKGPKDFGNAVAFAQTAFNLPQMELSDITEIGESYYLIQVINKKPAAIPGLDEIKEKITKDAKRAQQKIAAKEAAEKFLEKAKAAGSIEAAAEGDPLVIIKSTGLMQRKGTIPGIGNDQKLMTAAFELTEKDKLPDNVIETNTGSYVIELKERKLPEAQEGDIAKGKIHDRILSQKQTALYNSWIDSLRKNSKITISKDFLDN